MRAAPIRGSIGTPVRAVSHGLGSADPGSAVQLVNSMRTRNGFVFLSLKYSSGIVAYRRMLGCPPIWYPSHKKLWDGQSLLLSARGQFSDDC